MKKPRRKGLLSPASFSSRSHVFQAAVKTAFRTMKIGAAISFDCESILSKFQDENTNVSVRNASSLLIKTNSDEAIFEVESPDGRG